MRLEQIARDTVQILERGFYQAPSGNRIDLSEELHQCVESTRCYEPDSLAAIREQVLARPSGFPATLFVVANETTLQGSARLALEAGSGRVGVLNFASARNPGGGFLRRAQ